MTVRIQGVGAAAPDLLPNVWRMFGALAVVLSLLAAAAWLLRRGVLGRRTTGGLGIESMLALGERRSLAIVTIEGRRLLVGLAPNNVSLVTELGLPSPKPRGSDAGGLAPPKLPMSDPGGSAPPKLRSSEGGPSFEAAVAKALDGSTS